MPVASTTWLRTVAALIVVPLLPIFLLILSTGNVLPVVTLVDTYPTALAIGVPLYALMRWANKTRLRHFLLFSFCAFGLLSFASAALSRSSLSRGSRFWHIDRSESANEGRDAYG